MDAFRLKKPHPPPLPPSVENRRANRWDSDDSDEGGPASPVRGIRDRPPSLHSDVETPAKRYGERENRIVMGLDYGTTASGLAWMHQRTTAEPTFADVKQFTAWREETLNSKVPSQISYSKGSKTEDKLVLHWTKLELEARRPVTELEALRHALDGLALLKCFRSADNPELTHDIPRHLSKTPANIVRDFLLTVARSYYTFMVKQQFNALTKGTGVPLDILITHPADWEYEPLNKLYRAVMDAFHKQMFPTRRSVYLVSEPEACALFTVQRLISTNENNLIPGDCFVICDAGGGTVDLVTYKINSIDPLDISRVAVVTGANCGATSIDRAFTRWLKLMSTNLDMGDDDASGAGHFLLTPARKALLTRFEPLKRQFTGTEDNTITIARDVIMKPGTSNYANGLLTIKAADMRRFFEESLNGTLSLIAKQVEITIAQGDEVTKIFMSGGLSQSEYLFRKVQDWALNDAGDIEVKRPSECWTAVAQGAVLCGAGLGAPVPPPVGACPRHYGIAASEPWNPWRHTERTAICTDGVHGHPVAAGQITWLARQGDVLLPGRPVEARQRVSCAFQNDAVGRGSVAKITFCAAAQAEVPNSLAELPADSNEIATLDVKLDEIPTTCRRFVATDGRSHMVVLIDVAVRVGYNNGKGVSVQALCDGRGLARYNTSL